MSLPFSPFTALKAKIYAGLAIAAIAGCIVQTVRLEGLHVWPISIVGWIRTAEDRRATIDRMIAAQVVAADNARKARLEQEALYRSIAERIDDNANAQLRDELAVAERFIAAGGVRAEAPRCEGGDAGTGASDRRAGRTEGAGSATDLDDAGGASGRPDPGDGHVRVPAEDVRICTINTIKAEAARSFVLELEAASRSDAGER